jgi:phosphate:Na+ symporter
MKIRVMGDTRHGESNFRWTSIASPHPTLQELQFCGARTYFKDDPMQTLIAVLGGVGLFLLGMGVMTGGLKALAGSKLRGTLRRMAATPASGVFWGAFVTLIVQSSSATTMTTIGLVSAGLLTFAQGLGLVFGANVGTTGTGWLIALIGVRVSLTAAAMPMIFIGALLKLLGRERVAAAGSSIAGFALVLFGLTTLQQGMTGVAEQLHPADFPAIFSPGISGWSSMWGVLMLVGLGLAMTAVMQSSTAAIAVTLSAYFAGAIGLEQACALIIGQNIGTATSSAMAAIGASSTAKRLALAYVLFKLIAASIALMLFPATVHLITRAAKNFDGVTLLAAYHTAYNVIGVAILLPLIRPFTRLVERILPERRSPLTRNLDPAVLATPMAAEEAVRRTIARALAALCESVGTALTTGASVVATEAGDALREAWQFMSEVNGPPESDEEQARRTHTLHALDEATHMAEVAGEHNGSSAAPSTVQETHVLELCSEAMRNATLIANAIGVLADNDAIINGTSVESALAQLENCAITLRELQRDHRKDILAAIATNAVDADDAIARMETVKRLEALSRHAWRCAVHIVD